MALRSGSGGLKYPLPNQAALVAQMSGNAASSGGSASASAYGANRSFAANKMRVQADLANAAADRDFRARSQMQEQGFRAQQEFYDREHEAGAQLEAQRAAEERQAAQFAQQTELQLGQQGFAAGQADISREFQAEQAGLDRQYDAQGDLQRFNREQFMKLPEIPENAPPDVRRDLQNKRAALGELAGQNWDPNDPEVRRTFDQTMKDYMSGVQAIPTPTLDEQFSKKTVERNGRLYQQGKNGEFSELSDLGQQDAMKQDQQRRAEIKKRADEYTQTAKPGGKGQYTFEEGVDKAMADLEREQAVLDKKLKPQPAAPVPSAPNQPVSSDADAIFDNGRGGVSWHEAVQEAQRRNGRPTGQQGAAPAQPPVYRPSLAMPEAGSPTSPLTQPLPELLPGHPGYQPQAGPRTLPQTPGSGAGITAVPLGGAPGGAGPYNTWQGPTALNQMPRPASAAERDSLPPGTTYVTPNGEIRKKK